MNKRISKKMLMAYINSIANVVPSPISKDRQVYVSKIDGSYISTVGLESELKHFLKKGINKIQSYADEDGSISGSSCIGFNSEEDKWYGWSHRAIYGFGIGSECKKGNYGYVASTPELLFDNVTKKDKDGYQWQEPENVELLKDGIRIRTEMMKPVGDDGNPVSAYIVNTCDEVIGRSGKIMDFEPTEPSFFEIKCGRGEWTATNLIEAKIMAIDFAKGVS